MRFLNTWERQREKVATEFSFNSCLILPFYRCQSIRVSLIKNLIWFSVTVRYNAPHCCVITQHLTKPDLIIFRAHLSCVQNVRSKHHSHDDIQIIMMPNQAQIRPRLIWLIVIIRYTFADAIRSWIWLMIESLCRCDLIGIWIILGCINSDSHLPVQCWSSSVSSHPRDDPQMIQIVRTST